MTDGRSGGVTPETIVGLFIPCFVDQCRPDIAAAMVRVLERCGFRVHFDPLQTCCGQPAFNSGHDRYAAAVGRCLLHVLSRYDVVVAPSGSCVSMVRHRLPELVPDQAGVCGRVWELCEFLANEQATSRIDATWAGRVALHMPCHLLRELRAASAVRAVLASVRGLEVVELPSSEWCCGFGGMFAVEFPELSTAMARTKLTQVMNAGIDTIVSPEASCLLQLECVARAAQLPLRFRHVAELLAGAETPLFSGC